MHYYSGVDRAATAAPGPFWRVAYLIGRLHVVQMQLSSAAAEPGTYEDLGLLDSNGLHPDYSSLGWTERYRPTSLAKRN